jgi:hypothetical protein
MMIHFLNAARDGGQRSASISCRFTSWERTPGTHVTGSYVGSRAGLDALQKRAFLPLMGIVARVFGRLAGGMVTVSTTLPGSLKRLLVNMTVVKFSVYRIILE